MRHKRILVAPLDWGLGHASRCIPIIRELIKQGAEVIIGAQNKPLALLKKEFPELESLVLPGMNVAYPTRLPLSVFMGLKAPRFLKWVQEEEALIESIIQSHQLDGIISDNRYGLHSETVPSVLMTHQLFIKASLLSNPVNRLTEKYAKQFSFCWVPDFAGEENLSGELSHGPSELKNLRYMGPISRFSKQKSPKDQGFENDLLVVLSGPEPRRTQFEKVLLKQLKPLDLKVKMVRGLVDAMENKWEKMESGHRINYLESKELEAEIQQSELVLCRSGYSSIMDLAQMGKRAFFVPTQGQTEQEYLAKRLKRENRVFSVSANKLNLAKQIEEAKAFQGLDTNAEPDLLERTVGEFLELIPE